MLDVDLVQTVIKTSDYVVFT